MNVGYRVDAHDIVRAEYWLRQASSISRFVYTYRGATRLRAPGDASSMSLAVL